jgi:hypothetical protein
MSSYMRRRYSLQPQTPFPNTDRPPSPTHSLTSSISATSPLLATPPLPPHRSLSPQLHTPPKRRPLSSRKPVPSAAPSRGQLRARELMCPDAQVRQQEIFLRRRSCQLDQSRSAGAEQDGRKGSSEKAVESPSVENGHIYVREGDLMIRHVEKQREGRAESGASVGGDDAPHHHACGQDLPIELLPSSPSATLDSALPDTPIGSSLPLQLHSPVLIFSQPLVDSYPFPSDPSVEEEEREDRDLPPAVSSKLHPGITRSLSSSRTLGCFFSFRSSPLQPTQSAPTPTSAPFSAPAPPPTRSNSFSASLSRAFSFTAKRKHHRSITQPLSPPLIIDPLPPSVNAAAAAAVSACAPFKNRPASMTASSKSTFSELSISRAPLRLTMYSLAALQERLDALCEEQEVEARQKSSGREREADGEEMGAGGVGSNPDAFRKRAEREEEARMSRIAYM